MQSILVGLDGSTYSSAAMELGIGWAKRFSALLVGLGIVDEPTICKPVMTGMWGGHYKQHRDAQLLADARLRVEGFLEQFRKRCTEAGVACEVLQDVGHPYQQILAEEQRYDLVLLGQETHFHFETTDRADETLRQVLKKSPRPVVVVPETPPGGNAVVVAYDGSSSSVRALQAFQASGLAEGREVHVVSVAAKETAATQTVGHAVEYLRRHHLDPQAHAVATREAPAEVLLREVQQRDAGLLVMGAFGRSALREWLFGSLTRTLLRDSPVPLFLCH
jgi:nucleotide-binding universal stress UspA family protein